LRRIDGLLNRDAHEADIAARRLPIITPKKSGVL